MRYLSNITRPAGDPKIIETGRSSLGAPDQLSRALGWFSMGLGLMELLAPRRLTRALGMEGNEGLVRAYGAREIGSGVLSLSVDKEKGLWSRVAGDGLDFVTLLTALRPSNPKRSNVGVALMMVVGITALDVFGARTVTARHSRGGGTRQRYRDRSGFPHGLEKARGAAQESRRPRDVRGGPASLPAAG